MQLTSGLDILNLDLTNQQIDALNTILVEHMKWNQVFNLSAHRTEHDVVVYQILDSLSVYPFISTGTLLDIGTGPGFPGLPLAVIFPETQITLLDSNDKKLSFARHIKSLCHLDNVEIVHQRIEDVRDNQRFDQIISRAFTHLNGMIECSLAFLKPDGEILAMKGAQAESEIVDAQSTHGNCIIRLHKLPHVVDEQRMLAVVKQRSE
jgi:16S rRNA (guanine527-N7)-methyltransferase